MEKNKKIEIVLAGHANVGKSVTFNHLTGLHQHIGNWPGKTVAKKEGTLHYKGYDINVIDLPGIYSLTPYSMEEIISREYIATQKPNFIVNVVDSTNLERNLLLTLQLLELEKPMVLALNMVDLLKKKGIVIDYEKLQAILNIPVAPIIAIERKGFTKFLDSGIELVNKKKTAKPLKYSQEVETCIKELNSDLHNIDLPYPRRWLAIKLLEKDQDIQKLIWEKRAEILNKATNLSDRLKKIYGHDSSTVISNERCQLVSRIVKKTIKLTEPIKLSWKEQLDNLTCHKIWGYPVMIAILACMFLFIFSLGNYLSGFLEIISLSCQSWYENLFPSGFLASLGWSGLESIIALAAIALPYILPFYLILFILEDWGYLARIAFLMDNFMHKVGVHGKASIPFMLGFGCNVPACLACRIMETQREKFLATFLTTLIPCSAVTVIIMGLVGKYVGISWAFALYFFTLIIIFILGKIASKILPGKPTELIMEMPDYKRPHLRTVLMQTWQNLKEFVYIAGPLVIISGMIIEVLKQAGWLKLIANFLSPITVSWLGLPAAVGILLILGILRKELILVMLATVLGTTNFAQVLSPAQMITLAIVSIFYIPCIATIAVLLKEFGWKKTMAITIFEITFAIILGGLTFKLLETIL